MLASSAFELVDAVVDMVVASVDDRQATPHFDQIFLHGNQLFYQYICGHVVRMVGRRLSRALQPVRLALENRLGIVIERLLPQVHQIA